MTEEASYMHLKKCGWVKKPKLNFERILCPLCESEKYKILSKKGMFGIPLNVSICKNCGLVYLNPRWIKEKYERFYKNEYDKFYIHEKTPKSTIKEIYNKIKQYLGEDILDVGAGKGEILSYLKKRTNNLFAVEPSERYKKRLKKNKINVIGEFIENLYTEEKFNLIMLNGVLEHLLKPNLVLKKIRDMLKPSGKVFITVPNLEKPILPLTKEFFRVMHTFYFNKITLQEICLKNGLKPIKIGEMQGGRWIYVILKKDKPLYKINKNNYENTRNNLKKYFKKELSSLISYYSEKIRRRIWKK